MKNKYNFFKVRKGFTLIELLVVIAIIGILSTLTTITMIGSKEKSRDVGRKTDLRSIKTALSLYYSDQRPNIYHIPSTNPANLDTEANAREATGLTTDYIKNFPLAPEKGPANMPYVYRTSTSGNDFALYAQLENGTDGDIKTTAPVAGDCPTGYTNCFWTEND